MVYAPIINELAVTATTFQRNNVEDLSIVENLLIGFHGTYSLSDPEVSLLWDAIILRLLITVLLSEVKLKIGTDHDTDVLEDRTEAYDMLVKIEPQDHNSIVNKLRAACGYN